MSENTENQTIEKAPANTAEAPQAEAPQAEAPKNVLLGSISYSDEAAYEQFLQKMDVNQAVFILVSAANFAQSKGSFAVQESELIAVATRTIKKSSASAKPVDSAPPAPETVVTPEK